MSIVHAVVLGVVQGLAEFLPISSSGHLRLVPWVLGWNDFAVADGVERTFDVALHLGTLAGAVAYFWSDLVRLARAGLSALRSADRASVHATTVVDVGVTLAPGREAPYGDERKIAWLLLASAVPAASVGAVFSDSLEGVAEQEWIIGVLLIGFGLVLLWADRRNGTRGAETFRLHDALAMGAAQALALAPGVSRSGATITAGRWLGLERDAAARLSFLMSLPVIGGAVFFEGAKTAVEGIPTGFAGAFTAGVVASAVTGYLAVWGTLRLVRSKTFAPFAAYRVIVGAVVILIAASPWR